MKRILTLIQIILLLALLSCKKLIEIDSPQDRQTTITVFASDETANAALTGIYARMSNESTLPYNIPLMMGQYGDELKNFSTSKGLVSIYTNSLNQIEGVLPNLWQIGYNHIYQANAVWEGCDQSKRLRPDVKKQLMAEARFIRAFWFFYLTNIYGNIPLATSTDYTINNYLKNSDKGKVYAQIFSDLLEAESDINPNYVSGNSISTSEDRVRPNVYVVKSFLSRAYLYSENYDKAEAKASEVINNNIFYNLEPLAGVFLKGSREAIWQIMTPSPTFGTSNTYEGLNFILTNRPSTGLTVNSTISPQLLSSFELGDKRRTSWIGEYIHSAIVPNVSYYFPYKYKIKSSTAASAEYTTPFRLGELYLVRAEARVHLGKLSQAIDDLDSLRSRAGLPLIKNVNPQIAKDDLLKLIFHERQVELFAEWGHRWFDLKRSGHVDQVMSVVAVTKGGTWSSHKQLWPIPIREIQNNPNLSQNTGYN